MTVVESVSDSANSLLNAIDLYAAGHHDGLVALALFAGVVIAFSGRTLLKPTVFLLGFVPATVTIIALGLALVQDENPEHVSLLEGIAIVVALAAGILVGVIMLRLLFRIATFVLCAGFGAVLVLVFHLFLLDPAVGKNAQFILYAAAIFAALIAGLFSVSYPETGIILGTSFDGAALAVFSLARFLGHRPDVLAESVQAGEDSVWWAIGYGIATLLLGVFGALTQRQVAVADAIIAQNAERKKQPDDDQYDPMVQSPYMGIPGEGHHLMGMAEPPRTPPYMRSSVESPAASGYGAMDQEDTQYSVVHNLGAAPLEPSINTHQGGKNVNGPL